MAVAVRADVLDPSSGEASETNEFLYTMTANCASQTEEGEKCPASALPRRVRPRRYENVDAFLQGRRAIARTQELRAEAKDGRPQRLDSKL